jgi:hypothetical protein
MWICSGEGPRGAVGGHHEGRFVGGSCGFWSSSTVARLGGIWPVSPPSLGRQEGGDVLGGPVADHQGEWLRGHPFRDGGAIRSCRRRFVSGVRRYGSHRGVARCAASTGVPSLFGYRPGFASTALTDQPGAKPCIQPHTGAVRTVMPCGGFF